MPSIRSIFLSFLLSIFFWSGAEPAVAAPDLTDEDVLSRTILISGVVGGGMLRASSILLGMADKSSEDIVLILDSPGGSVDAGYWFVNHMQEVQARGIHISCVVGSEAASMAFQILLHCNSRFGLPTSMLLFHGARVQVMFGVLDQQVSEKLARDLASINNLVRGDVSKYLVGASSADIQMHFLAETFHTPAGMNLLSPGFIQVQENIPGLLPLLEKYVKRGSAAGNIRTGRILLIRSSYLLGGGVR